MDVQYLFESYRNDVYRLALNYTRNPQEAEDVCQTVFLKLMEQTRIRPGKEKAWLMQVTANECRSLLRSHWWKTTVPLNETILADGPEVDETLQALSRLKPEYRAVLYLYYYEGYSTEDIARIMKISGSTVRTRLERGRNRLRNMLQEG